MSTENNFTLSYQNKHKQTQRITIVGSIIDTILGFGKVIIGFLFHSHALIIDGIHSLTDLLTDIFVLVITHYSNQAPDENHPYGHEKIETIGTAALGSILLGTSGALIFETLQKLLQSSTSEVPQWPTLLMAFVSFFFKEIIFRYTRSIGEKLKSPLLIANAWHSRTDAMSSIIVFIGVLSSMYGFPIMDHLAAVIVALLIASVGWKFVKESLSELAETSLDSSMRTKIMRSILLVEGVLDAHNLRTRKMGNKILLDVNIQVASDITVSEGHEISSWVSKVLKDTFSDITDITVHTDVENDMQGDFDHGLQKLLPLRKSILAELSLVWSDETIFISAQRINIHYIKRKVFIEIIHLNKIHSDEHISINRLKEKADKISWFEDVSILIKN